MLKKIKISTVAGLFSLVVGVQAAPVISVDAPTAGQAVTGIIQIYGWASDVIKMDQVTVQFGNQPELIIGYGGERNDVGAQRPDDDDANHAGFSTALNTHLLRNGSHTVTLAASNVNGETTAVSFAIVVFNPPGSQGQDWIDLTGAGTRLQGQNIILEQAAINGQTHANVVLRFDGSTNGFHLADISTGSTGDASAAQGKTAYFEYGCAQSACHSVDPVANQNQVLKGSKRDVISEAFAVVPQMAMLDEAMAGNSRVMMDIAAYLDSFK